MSLVSKFLNKFSFPIKDKCVRVCVLFDRKLGSRPRIRGTFVEIKDENTRIDDC